MSVCALAERTISLDATRMEEPGDDGTPDNTPSDGNEVREPKVAKADPTPTAVSPMLLGTASDAQSDGNVAYCRNRPGNTATRKDCLRSMHLHSLKLGSGSGSGDPEPSQTDEGGDPAAKKRKTRRGKPKYRKIKPYPKSQMSYGRSHAQRRRGLGRLTKTGGQPPAPYNTTQFLMEDHSDLPDLEQKLADVITSEMNPSSFQKPFAPPRTRDSSFSVDSDEDYFYSSPEDEEEFLTKEFSSAYEDLHRERLNTMTKTELIQEYVQLEAKLDLMVKRLRTKGLQQPEERETEAKKASDGEMAKKLKICQQRIDDLMQQNEQLRRENEKLRTKNRASPVSSVDSESDSDSTTNGNRSSCSDTATAAGKSMKNRRDKEQRRSKRRSSEESESDSSSSGESSSSSSPRSVANGNSSQREIDGLPT